MTHLSLARSHQAGNSETLQHSVTVSQHSLELIPLLSLGRHVSVGTRSPHRLVPSSHGGLLDVGTDAVQHDHGQDVQTEQAVDPEEEIPEVRPLDVVGQTRGGVATDHPARQVHGQCGASQGVEGDSLLARPGNVPDILHSHHHQSDI